MYSILIKIVKDRDIYEKYKVYDEENNMEKDYSVSSLEELTEKVEELIRSGVRFSDIKAVSEMNTEIDLKLNGENTGDSSSSSSSSSDMKVEEETETLVLGSGTTNASDVNYIAEKEMLII